MPRLLPETLTQAETERLLDGRRPADALLDRALLELLYAAGLRISEALRLDLEDVSLDGAFVRVIGKGDRERLVPVGEVASTRSAPGSRGPRAALVAGAPRASRSAAARCSSAGAGAGSRASRPGRS